MTTIQSSHGTLEIDGDTGRVLDVRLDDPEDHALEGGHNFLFITHFDVAEWRRAYNRPLPDELDILDLGYWYAGDPNHGEGYESPCHDWRRWNVARDEFPQEATA